MTFRFFTFLFFVSITCFGQNPNYDKALADSLGADDYGMKTYTFVILKTGPANITDKDSLDWMFRGHFANIGRMVDAGKLVVAGPYGENDRKYRGLFILDVGSTEEAMEWMSEDPTIKHGVFEVEMTPWYGSAALPMYLDYHKMIEKTSVE